jgi:hypothetical protein
MEGLNHWLAAAAFRFGWACQPPLKHFRQLEHEKMD